jgi:hypothetical protein
MSASKGGAAIERQVEDHSASEENRRLQAPEVAAANSLSNVTVVIPAKGESICS